MQINDITCIVLQLNGIDHVFLKQTSFFIFMVSRWYLLLSLWCFALIPV